MHFFAFRCVKMLLGDDLTWSFLFINLQWTCLLNFTPLPQICVRVFVHFIERNQEKGDIGYVVHQEMIGCLELKWAMTKWRCSSFYGLLKLSYVGSNVFEENLILWLLESLRVQQGDHYTNGQRKLQKRN